MGYRCAITSSELHSNAFQMAFAASRHFSQKDSTSNSTILSREPLVLSAQKTNTCLSASIRKFIAAGWRCLAHFKEPSWFNQSNWKKARPSAQTTPERGRRSYSELGEQAEDIWGARGPAGDCARALQDIAFHPLSVTGKVVDDYRDKPKVEAQLACFIRNKASLQKFAARYETDQDMFAALEAADISDLFREMLVWVTRDGNDSGDVRFSDLSDGERQLLMVRL